MLAACVERALFGKRFIEVKVMWRVIAVGHALGIAVAIAWFSKVPPGPKSWFIAPAIAALTVVIWIHLLAPRLDTEA